jgi:hypothetical protein
MTAMATRQWGLAIASLAFAAGCFHLDVTHCPDFDCPKQMVCDGAGGCAVPEQLAQCSGQPDGTECSYTTVTSAHIDGACNTGVCRSLQVPACLADTFTDNIVDAGMWQLWLSDNQPVVVSQQGGQLAVTLAPGVGRVYNGVTSRGRYDMVAGNAAVAVTAASQDVGVETDFSVDLDSTTGYEMAAYASRLHLVVHTNGGVTNSIAVDYDPVGQKYWRIRHDPIASTIEFETSPDAMTWTSQRSAAITRAPTGVAVTLLAGTYVDVGVTDPGVAYFDELKLTSAACP